MSPPPLPPPGGPPPPHNSDSAILLTATFLDMSLFGLVAQQFFTYWTSGFKDPIHLKLFVNVQFALVTLQSIMMWHIVFKIFVVFAGQPPPPSSLWSGPTNSLCQLFIIVLANMFLATRIHGLTKSLLQSLLPVALSIIAFVFGMVTVVGDGWTRLPQSTKHATSVVWYTSQATAECLITLSLTRALLNSRSGVHRSDLVVRDLVRSVIQTGVLATIWAVAACISRFWLKSVLVYRVFDITSGSVYLHAIFDTLISRTHLRDRMAASAYVDFGQSHESQGSARRFPSTVIVSNFPAAPSSNTDSGNNSTLINRSDIMELKTLPTEKPDVRFEF